MASDGHRSLDVKLFEHASLVEIHGEVEGRLAHRREERVRLLDLDDSPVLRQR